MNVSFGRVMALAAVPLLLALGAGSASAQPASGNPPSKAFEAQSASFVSAQTGFVLGTRGCSRLPCTPVLEKTVNGGKTWASVPVPAVELVQRYATSPLSGVSTVRFENASDGWLYNPGLWATTNGGKTWQRVSMPKEAFVLAASDGVAFAVGQPSTGGLAGAKLYENKVGTAKWTVVPGVSPQNGLAVSGESVWAGIASGVDGGLWTSADSGLHWSKLSFRCPKVALTASPVAAASSSDVAIACSDQGYPQPGFSVKELFTSANGGRTFHLAGEPPEPGQVYGLAMPLGNPHVITLNAASGASWLYQSTDGGKVWKANEYYDGGVGFNDLAYVSATTGYVVHFMGSPVIALSDGLLKTTNAGKTWASVPIQ
jgi:photosystem II stability/assembly factor-like uncharacterized protein